ncbi:hypothetical protein K0M31_003344 [Melipona bicolor]|uniref:RRM domain-containing protein n=1 Tax=Melipona bicolor TaxID=60889 RepID=A0AA40KPD5_9HYME|nr:hypothetical protein K0M31_003344 [Melipona bicolor]
MSFDAILEYTPLECCNVQNSREKTKICNNVAKLQTFLKFPEHSRAVRECCEALWGRDHRFQQCRKNCFVAFWRNRAGYFSFRAGSEMPENRDAAVFFELFDWKPERAPGEPLRHERVVIIKNLFSPEDFDKEVSLLLEYQQDIRSECLKCGDVRKVVIYDRHPEGVAQVTFREPTEAQACVQLLNGRWFSQRKISAEIWDGKTRYKVAETDAETEARIAKWDQYLDDGQEEPRRKVMKSMNKGEQKQEETVKKNSEETETTKRSNIAERATTEEVARGTEARRIPSIQGN